MKIGSFNGRSSQYERTTAIALLTLDVFGFSRGAVTARKFINDALFGRKTWLPGRRAGNVDSSTSIRSQLQDRGYTIAGPGPKTGVKVCFAGLYDTVSSYGTGVPSDNDDNVNELSLNAVFHARKPSISPPPTNTAIISRSPVPEAPANVAGKSACRGHIPTSAAGIARKRMKIK